MTRIQWYSALRGAAYLLAGAFLLAAASRPAAAQQSASNSQEYCWVDAFDDYDCMEGYTQMDVFSSNGQITEIDAYVETTYEYGAEWYGQTAYAEADLWNTSGYVAPTSGYNVVIMAGTSAVASPVYSNPPASSDYGLYGFSQIGWISYFGDDDDDDDDYYVYNGDDDDDDGGGFGGSWQAQVNTYVDSASMPYIDSISPTSDAPGNSGSIDVSGNNLVDLFCWVYPYITDSNITLGSNSNCCNSSDIKFPYSISDSDSGGQQTFWVLNGYGSSNGVTFAVYQVPASLVYYNYPTCAPQGVGQMQTIINGTVQDCGGVVHAINFCGVSRNLVYQLLDTTGAPFKSAYTLTEYFGEFISIPSGVFTAPPQRSVDIAAGGLVTDAQFIGFTAPTCLGYNNYASYVQFFTVTVNGVDYPINPEVSISLGSFNGTLEDNVYQ